MNKICAGVVVLLAVISACGGAQNIPRPTNFPVVASGWSGVLANTPVSAEAALFANIDDSLVEQLIELLENPIQPARWIETVEDAAGVDFHEPGVLSRLGFDGNGGLGVFQQHGDRVAVFDLIATDELENLLEQLPTRNPDLTLSSIDSDWGDLFAITSLASDEPSLYLLLGDSQAAVLQPGGLNDPVDTIEQVIAMSWEENAMFNDRVVEAITSFGGDSSAIGYAETDDVLHTFATENTRCNEARSVIAQSLPYVLFGHETGQARDDITSERTRVHMALSSEAVERASRLLRATPISPEHLSARTIVAGFLNLDSEAFVSTFQDWANVRGCGGPVSGLGWLGFGAQAAAEVEGLTTQINGLLAWAFFDFRVTSSIPFADVYVHLGSRQAASAVAFLQRALEEEVGAAGTPGELAGFSSIQYRIALLYRLTLLQAPAAVGIALGRVDENWLTNLLGTEGTQSEAFFLMRVDAPRLADAIGIAIESGLAGQEQAIDPQDVGSELDRLRAIQGWEVTGTLRDGFIRFQRVEY